MEDDAAAGELGDFRSGGLAGDGDAFGDEVAVFVVGVAGGAGFGFAAGGDGGGLAVGGEEFPVAEFGPEAFFAFDHAGEEGGRAVAFGGEFFFEENGAFGEFRPWVEEWGVVAAGDVQV